MYYVGLGINAGKYRYINTFTLCTSMILNDIFYLGFFLYHNLTVKYNYYTRECVHGRAGVQGVVTDRLCSIFRLNLKLTPLSSHPTSEMFCQRKQSTSS